MKLFPIAAVAIASGLLAAPSVAQQAAPPAHDHSQPAPAAGGMMNHDKMMADMKEVDAKLQVLAQKMASASGADKVGAMQELLTELVKNQVEMHHHMSMMHDHMMGQMQHK